MVLNNFDINCDISSADIFPKKRIKMSKKCRSIFFTDYNFSYQSRIKSATISQPGSPHMKWLLP